MKFSIITSPRHVTSSDVTYLFTDPDEIRTAYVKLNSKHILFVRIFRFIFRDNYDYSFHIYIKYDRGFTDRDKNLHSICKIEFYAHFVHGNFFIYDIFFEIITIIM